VAILFISDLHIDVTRPDITEQFVEFLRTEARGADALYILGDLFESWVGDDDADAGQSAAIAELRSFTAAGVPCFVMHGNRDFLLGRQFCLSSGVQLLPDPLLVTLYGEPVLVMHGDALCTDDRAYQRLRATVRDADWQRQFLELSVAARRALAGAARVGSRAHTAGVPYAITDVNAESVASVLRPEYTRWKSTVAPVRASSSVTGIPKGACCAGTRAAPSSSRCRALNAGRLLRIARRSLKAVYPNESETAHRAR
jgi:UDP-2,3-diacylglucosamine hydrolase